MEKGSQSKGILGILVGWEALGMVGVTPIDWEFAALDFSQHLGRCGPKSHPIQEQEWENVPGITARFTLQESSFPEDSEAGKSCAPKGIPGS